MAVRPRWPVHPGGEPSSHFGHSACRDERRQYHAPVRRRPRLSSRGLRRRELERPRPQRRGRFGSSAVWLPVITLVIGSALTLATTVIAGRFAAADDRAREQEAFLREQQSVAYAEHLQSLAGIKSHLGDIRDLLYSDQPVTIDDVNEIDDLLWDRVAALDETEARVAIVGADTVVDGMAVLDARLSLAAYTGQQILIDAYTLDLDDRILVGQDLFDIMNCTVANLQNSFTSAANASLSGRDIDGSAIDMECTDPLDDYVERYSAAYDESSG